MIMRHFILRASLTCASVLSLSAGSGSAQTTIHAGVSGSHLEPWQQGGLPDGADRAPTLAVTIEAMPRNLPRAVAPGLALSIAAASAAVADCTRAGVMISALVTDAVGGPIVLLSGDGAGVRSQLIARTKANIVVRFGVSSGEVAIRAKSDPALTAVAAADPSIGVLREGAFPVLHDRQRVGIISVSGGSLRGDFTLDERCARAGLAVLDEAIAKDATSALVSPSTG